MMGPVWDSCSPSGGPWGQRPRVSIPSHPCDGGQRKDDAVTGRDHGETNGPVLYHGGDLRREMIRSDLYSRKITDYLAEDGLEGPRVGPGSPKGTLVQSSCRKC